VHWRIGAVGVQDIGNHIPKISRHLQYRVCLFPVAKAHCLVVKVKVKVKVIKIGLF